MNKHQEPLNDIFDTLLRINGLLIQKIENEARSLGYTAKTYLVLLDVLTHQGTSQNAMCERVGIKKSAASKILRHLEDNNQIVRKGCIEDRRESKLYIEDETLLKSLCKTAMIQNTFAYHDACLIDIQSALERVIKMLSGTTP